MSEKLIFSKNRRKRSPLAAFFMSFMLTGLGQVYSGQYLNGLSYIMLRSIFILIPAFYSQAKPGSISYLNEVCISLITALLLTLINPIHSIFSAIKAARPDSFNTKKYFLRHYILFIILNLTVTGISLFFFFHFFSFTRITKDSQPLFSKGDIVLTYRNNSGTLPKRNTMYLTEKGDILRISLLEKESINLSGNSTFINKRKYELIVPDEDELKLMQLNNYDILLCRSGKIKYPLIPMLSRRSLKFSTSSKEVLLLSDDRRNNFINIKKTAPITYKRVEGIIIKKGQVFNLPVKTFIKN